MPRGAARAAAVARAEACAAEGKGVTARTSHCAALRAVRGAALTFVAEEAVDARGPAAGPEPEPAIEQGDPSLAQL